MATLIEELNKASQTFDAIWENAGRVTCGNLPHQIGQVRALAINQAQLIRQWIKLGETPLTESYMDRLEGWLKVGGLNPRSDIPAMYSKAPIRVTFVDGRPHISIILGPQGVVAKIRTGVTRERLQRLVDGLDGVEITPLR